MNTTLVDRFYKRPQAIFVAAFGAMVLLPWLPLFAPVPMSTALWVTVVIAALTPVLFLSNWLERLAVAGLAIVMGVPTAMIMSEALAHLLLGACLQ